MTKEQGGELGTALTSSIGADGLDMAADLGDAGLEVLLSSGALDGIPIVGILAGIYKTGRHIPTYLYQRKVLRLLAAVAGGTSSAERRVFAEQAEACGEARKLGELILLLIDKCDEMGKATLIGKIMAAHIRGDLSCSDSLRLSAMINRAYLSDLYLLRSFRAGTGAPQQTLYATLAAVGFLDNDGVDGGVFGTDDPALKGGTIFSINSYAVALIRFGFGLDCDAKVEIGLAQSASAEAEQQYFQSAAQKQSL